MANVWANSMACHPISHCRVLPLGEFTATISEPHATLQSAVTWRNQCHDRATLQGVRIPSAVLKSFYAIFYFFVLFLMQFRLWRAVAFASSPIHLLFWKLPQIRTYNFHKVLRQYTDAKYYMSFVGNLLLFPAVKGFWKYVKNWQSYRHEFGVLFFGTQCTSVHYLPILNVMQK